MSEMPGIRVEAAPFGALRLRYASPVSAASARAEALAELGSMSDEFDAAVDEAEMAARVIGAEGLLRRIRRLGAGTEPGKRAGWDSNPRPRD